MIEMMDILCVLVGAVIGSFIGWLLIACAHWLWFRAILWKEKRRYDRAIDGAE